MVQPVLLSRGDRARQRFSLLRHGRTRKSSLFRALMSMAWAIAVYLFWAYFGRKFAEFWMHRAGSSPSLRRARFRAQTRISTWFAMLASISTHQREGCSNLQPMILIIIAQVPKMLTRIQARPVNPSLPLVVQPRRRDVSKRLVVVIFAAWFDPIHFICSHILCQKSIRFGKKHIRMAIILIVQLCNAAPPVVPRDNRNRHLRGHLQCMHGRPREFSPTVCVERRLGALNTLY